MAIDDLDLSVVDSNGRVHLTANAVAAFAGLGIGGPAHVNYLGRQGKLERCSDSDLLARLPRSDGRPPIFLYPLDKVCERFSLNPATFTVDRLGPKSATSGGGTHSSGTIDELRGIGAASATLPTPTGDSAERSSVEGALIGELREEVALLKGRLASALEALQLSLQHDEALDDANRLDREAAESRAQADRIRRQQLQQYLIPDQMNL